MMSTNGIYIIRECRPRYQQSTHHSSHQEIRAYLVVAAVLKDVSKRPYSWGDEIPRFSLTQVLWTVRTSAYLTGREWADLMPVA